MTTNMRTERLTTKEDNPEVITTTKAVNMEEAILLFSQIKDLTRDQLLELFYVVKGKK